MILSSVTANSSEKLALQLAFAKAMRAGAVVVTLVILQGLACAQALSKADILSLKDAGVSDEVVIKQIETNGVTFQLSAADIIALKAKGFPDRLLEVMLSGKTSSGASDQYASFRAMYAAHDFASLADALKASLVSNTQDHRARALYALTLLRMGDKDDATRQLSILRESTSGEAQKYAGKLNLTFEAVANNEDIKKDIANSLKAFNAHSAREALDKLHVSSAQEQYLNATLDVFEAKFDSARLRLIDMSKSSEHRDSLTAQQALSRLDELERNYKQSLANIDGYIHSPFMPAWCNANPAAHNLAKTYMAKTSNSLANFVTSVDEAAAVAPLSPEVLNLQFLRLMLTTQKFDDFKVSGLKILRATQEIAIPFYGQEEFVDLVINLRDQRIYTRPYPKAFFGGLSGKGGKNSWNGALKPFDLHFGDIQGIEQNAGSSNTGPAFTKDYGLPAKHQYALRFEPGGGTAPHYAFMHYLHCTVGQAAQQTATRNLGQFIADLMPKSLAQVRIVVPDEKFGAPADKFFLAFTMVNGAMYSAAGGAPGTATDMVIQSTTKDLQQSIDSAQGQRNSATALSSATWLSTIDTSVFSDIEKLLDLV